jgi:RecG-like helicase
MNRKKLFKPIVIVLLIAFVTGTAVVYYMFNKPHRDVQATSVDFQLSASDLVAEYLNDYDKANDKYLDDEGESKILSVTGTVVSIDIDYNNQKVVLLKSPTDKAGVSCTFTAETNASVNGIEIGQEVTIKGVIRSGATYDDDLEMYEDVNIEKCDIL